MISVLTALLAAALVIGERGGFFADLRAPSPPGEEAASSEPASPPPLATPYTRVDAVALTVPEELRAAHGSVFLEGGRSYLATVSVSTLKPTAEPGLGMYLGVTFSCAGAESGESEWTGGTENLLPGEEVTFRNQLLITPVTDEMVACSVRANAPYDDVASAGSTIELDIEWTVDETEGRASSTPSEQRLPVTVVRDARAFAFTQPIADPDRAVRSVSMRSSLHLTTCTGINGSRENGREWCAEEDLDEGGSAFDVELRVEAVGEDGQVCAVLGRRSVEKTLSLERHHQLLHVAAEFEIPEDRCGVSLRTSVAMANSGPASLVVHEGNSSLITVVS